ncbi:MAG: prepilin-type N-terminal cleavage/methylation domain-containing protein [Thiohalocapsa sp.]|jgi:general secretion pathway protein J|uniref:prepilin-type N-terminal cleavage/methylation domain-containing protein n=1 Tax=Thiohalocapsa sp. TaxID=2497641 RepID=UPI0025EF5780|nr:prepilin-type N-terminal cleavage/methylation domain-containing protein [Thiohalocapsa sp.]MCG6941199.1 prepilin-type N-terminal cleavage/methylation domain-containing protein [Thiohalocapsa sp.]
MIPPAHRNRDIPAAEAPRISAARLPAGRARYIEPGTRRRQTGFTLVELLIALALIAVITVLLFSGLRLGSRAWEGVETVSDRVNDLRVARNFIERALRQVRSESVLLDGQQWPVFAGDAHSLEFVAPLSEHVGIPGLYILRLVVEPAGDHDRLVLVRWLLHPDALAGGDAYPAWEPLAEASSTDADQGPLDSDVAAGAYGRTVLLPQVKQFELAYFGVEEGETDPKWLEEWEDQSELPQSVRIAVGTPRESWPAAVLELPGRGAISSVASLPAALGQSRDTGTRTPPGRPDDR